MGTFAFGQVGVLWLLILVPVAALFLWSRERARRARLERIGDAALVDMLARRVSRGRRAWKSVLWTAAIACLIVAMARPMWGVRTDVVQTQGVSVFVLLDVSESMNAEDLVPSRLARAKIGIRDLAAGIEGNEIGMVAFAGSAFVVFPLTTDVNSVQTFLNFVSTNTISRQGTAIGTAIQLALSSFDEAGATERVIVLVTDGENHTGDLTPALAAASDVPVHVLGYGTENGGSIPIRNSEGLVVGNKRDRTGNVVITRLDEALLRDIADRTGGTYQRVDTSGAPIESVVQRINALGGGVLGDDEAQRGVERFALFVALALMLLSVEMLTTESRS